MNPRERASMAAQFAERVDAAHEAQFEQQVFPRPAELSENRKRQIMACRAIDDRDVVVHGEA
ncbi:MAG: hypothetical protein R3E48_06595 [Burkholderiaceae bacterium]